MVTVAVYRGKNLIQTEKFTDWNDECNRFIDKMGDQGFTVDARNNMEKKAAYQIHL